MDVSTALIVEVDEPLEQDEDWDDGRLEGRLEAERRGDFLVTRAKSIFITYVRTCTMYICLFRSHKV